MNLKEITVYGGGYLISDCGKVFNSKGDELKPQFDGKKRYLHICLCLNGVPKRFLVHRLVAIHFCDNVEGKPNVNHIDGVTTNNASSNLEWCTQAENMYHSYHVLKNTKGTVPMLGKSGFDHNKSKPIRAITVDGVEKVFGSVSELARETGCSVSLGANILKFNRKLPYEVIRGNGKGTVITEYPAKVSGGDY